jgi:hypothetical protein
VPPDPPALPGLPLSYALSVMGLDPGRRAYRVWCDTGFSAARFFQLVNAMMDDPASCLAEPVACNRLRDLRHDRRVRRGDVLSG